MIGYIYLIDADLARKHRLDPFRDFKKQYNIYEQDPVPGFPNVYTVYFDDTYRPCNADVLERYQKTGCIIDRWEVWKGERASYLEMAELYGWKPYDL